MTDSPETNSANTSEKKTADTKALAAFGPRNLIVHSPYGWVAASKLIDTIDAKSYNGSVRTTSLLVATSPASSMICVEAPDGSITSTDSIPSEVLMRNLIRSSGGRVWKTTSRHSGFEGSERQGNGGSGFVGNGLKLLNRLSIKPSADCTFSKIP